MKRFLLVMAMVLVMAFPAFGQVSNWATANQVTLKWAPVTTLVDGSPLPSGFSVSYKVYTKIEGTAPVTEVATVNVPQATITFTVEGKYVLGVKTIRLDSNLLVVSESPIVWSNDPLSTKGGITFGVLYFVSPATVKDMELQ